MATWKCIFDSTTLIGTGCNRAPGPNEIAREVDTALCGWFNVSPGRYKLENDVPVERPEWASEQAEQARLTSFNNLKSRIIEKRRAMNDADFAYMGVQYVSDEQNILGVKSQIEGLDDAEPIPTFVGTAIASTWANAENGFAPFNCGQFRDFASHYYNHREKNFTNYTLLTIAATQAYMSGATVEQLDGFDISQGWD